LVIHTVFEIWTLFTTGEWPKKYIIYTLNSVLIHCTFSAFLDSFAVCRPNVSEVLCSVSDPGRPPVEWTLAVARMVCQQTSLTGLLRSIGAQSFRARAYVAKVTFSNCGSEKTVAVGIRKEGQDDSRTGAYHSLWTQPCANGTMWHTEVLNGANCIVRTQETVPIIRCQCGWAFC
jgi:hypothetical protein